MKPFDLEAFKAGQKALTREGQIATFIGINFQLHENSQLVTVLDDNDYTTFYYINGNYGKDKGHKLDLVSMASIHQHLIYNYDPKDTWQFRFVGSTEWTVILSGEPKWYEDCEYRIHPHNDLIKAYKKGAKIERLESGGYFVDVINPTWNEHTKYRIKPDLEFTYPIYKQSEFSGVVVEFTDLTTGKVLVDNDFYEVNYAQSTWSPHTDATQWQDWTPITKSKPTTHCLAYDAKRLDHEQKTAVRAKVVKKENAEANGWTIIQEWEV